MTFYTIPAVRGAFSFPPSTQTIRRGPSPWGRSHNDPSSSILSFPDTSIKALNYDRIFYHSHAPQIPIPAPKPSLFHKSENRHLPHTTLDTLLKYTYTLGGLSYPHQNRTARAPRASEFHPICCASNDCRINPSA